MFAVDFHHVTKTFGKTDNVLNDVNFSVDAGSFYGILSSPHSGKTTLLRMIFDLLHPSEGRIDVFERDSVKNSVKIRRSASYVPARIEGQSHMSVRAMLETLTSYSGKFDVGRMQELCFTFGLNPLSHFDVLQVGERKRLMIISALMNDYPLIVLDEPTLDIEPDMQGKVFEELHRLHSKGSTILFTTSRVEEIRSHCTHVALLDGNSILAACLVNEMTALSAHSVTFELPNASEVVRELGIDNFREKGDSVSFSYPGTEDSLIKVLSQYPIRFLRIENPTLENVLIANRVLKKEQIENETES